MLLAKYVKFFIIVCLGLVVIAPWFLCRGRRGQTGDAFGSDGASEFGGGGYGGFDHHGGHDGGHAGGDGGGSH